MFLVATLHAEPIGCGGLKLPPGQPAEVKRMWVSERARGLGLGRRLLGELERHAAETGRDSIRLETNGALTEAIALYRSSGYEEIEPFNDEPYAHHWFGKRLAPAPAS
jgi:ribosomal protein S18 acetylase RimI-like enzyme